MPVNPHAGKPADASLLVDVPRLLSDYHAKTPDPRVREQRVAFGTSGHRGSSFTTSFNEWHILAISQALCLFRQTRHIDGPLFLGIDTHALSVPAQATALEVLAGNGVEVMLSEGTPFTPTPVISHAIVTYNRGRSSGFADGIVITPSHNPPHHGGFKYNPPHGGPAEAAITDWIGARANEFLEARLEGVRRMDHDQARRAPTTHLHDYREAYVSDLGSVLDMEQIAETTIGVDPLGGAGVHYWGVIAERYGLKLTVVNEDVDPTFRFMTVDGDGQIRMDPSSVYAMQRLIALKDRFDIAVACDTDHDRHGIVTRSQGLMPPNHYLSVATSYLFPHRPQWGPAMGVGKTVVSSQMIDHVAMKLGRSLHDMPVGFKWFVPGLMNGSLAFAGEESAGATCARRDGSVWTTDKDGLVPALLAAEITARLGRDPGELYHDLTREFDEPFYERVDVPTTPEHKDRLAAIVPQDVTMTALAGERITEVLTHAPGNGEAIGGVKIRCESGWIAARPSGTEAIYKIYAESFTGAEHLRRLIEDGQALVATVLGAAQDRPHAGASGTQAVTAAPSAARP